MKKKFLCLGALAICLALASCSSSSDVIHDAELCEFCQTESVAGLTEQLRNYDSRFPVRTAPLFKSSGPKTKLSWVDWLKIGIADIKGGIAGYKEGGWGGATWGAAIASLEKYLEIYSNKFVEKNNAVECSGALLASNTVSPTFNDSVGYYHNMAEEMLYAKYGNSASERAVVSLLGEADAYLKSISSGYRNTKFLTPFSKNTLTKKLSLLKEITDSDTDTFFDYCNKVKAIEPRDSMYIDFAAEYLYTCVCSNVGDLRKYTIEVLRRIDNSNTGSREKGILSSSVLIGFSSLMYSSQIECVEIKK